MLKVCFYVPKDTGDIGRLTDIKLLSFKFNALGTLLLGGVQAFLEGIKIFSTSNMFMQRFRRLGTR